MASIMKTLQGWPTLGLRKMNCKSPIISAARQMGKKVECWLPICDVVIRKIRADDPKEKCRVTNFIKNNVFRDDPLMIAAGIHRNDPDPGLIQYYTQCINQNNSLYAVIQSSREIVGACINRRSTPRTSRELKSMADGMVYKQSSRYLELLSVVEQRVSVYSAFDVPAALSIECLVTGREFRQRGIAKLLLLAVHDMAVNDDKYKLMKLTTGNTYAGKAAHICAGMKLHSFRNPLEYKDDKGEQLIFTELPLPHKNLEVYVSRVQKQQKKKKKE